MTTSESPFHIPGMLPGITGVVSDCIAHTAAGRCPRPGAIAVKMSCREGHEAVIHLCDPHASNAIKTHNQAVCAECMQQGRRVPASAVVLRS